MDAGAGNDTVTMFVDEAPDVIDCGPGHEDTVNWYGAPEDIDTVMRNCEYLAVALP